MELLIIFILTLLNGFFALSEIALVSVKKSRIEHLAAQGHTNAKTVLKLLDNPENFLSSVQVGITLIGIVSGAYGGAALTDDMVGLLSQFGFLGESVHTISLIIVIGGITYFTKELRFMLKTAGKQGVLENEESQAMQNQFSFTDQTAKSLMPHSSDVEWINYNWSKELIFDKIKESVHSKL